MIHLALLLALWVLLATVGAAAAGIKWAPLEERAKLGSSLEDSSQTSLHEKSGSSSATWKFAHDKQGIMGYVQRRAASEVCAAGTYLRTSPPPAPPRPKSPPPPRPTAPGPPPEDYPPDESYPPPYNEPPPYGSYGGYPGGGDPPPAYPPPGTSGTPPASRPLPPSPNGLPPPGANICLPCPEGSSSPAGAVNLMDCESCPPFFWAEAGGLCFLAAIPDIDLSKQRDVLFEFLGPNFTQFLTDHDQEYRNRLNGTLTSRVLAVSIGNGVWVYKWYSGSIVTEMRLTYPDGQTARAMDDDVAYLVNNAAIVFGDLSEWGITGIKSRSLSSSVAEEEKRDKTLALALGIGLGVGIPVLAGLILCLIWRKKNRDYQRLHPQGQAGNNQRFTWDQQQGHR